MVRDERSARHVIICALGIFSLTRRRAAIDDSAEVAFSHSMMTLNLDIADTTLVRTERN